MDEKSACYSIRDRNDYLYYVECDKIALKIPKQIRRPRLFRDEIWRFEIALRKVEYLSTQSGLLNAILLQIARLKHKRLGLKLGFTIPPNVFGPGLSIAHYGCIVVHPNAKVGANCRIHEGCTLGATNGSSMAPFVGNNCFIGSGAKLIGDVKIGDNVAIGAGAVVVNDFLDGNYTLGGVPARVISNKNSSSNVVSVTDIVNHYERRYRLS